MKLLPVPQIGALQRDDPVGVRLQVVGHRGTMAEEVEIDAQDLGCHLGFLLFQRESGGRSVRWSGNFLGIISFTRGGLCNIGPGVGQRPGIQKQGRRLEEISREFPGSPTLQNVAIFLSDVPSGNILGFGNPTLDKDRVG